jgi:hypothetical protein
VAELRRLMDALRIDTKKLARLGAADLKLLTPV